MGLASRSNKGKVARRRATRRPLMRSRVRILKRKRMTRSKSFARAQLRQTGLPIGSLDNTKRFQTILIQSGASSRTLFRNMILDIPGQNATTPADGKINSRTGASANVQGVKINFFMKNQDITQRCYGHMALLSVKNSKVVAEDGFFRDYGASRDVSFSTSLTGISMAHLPINTDIYNVIRHVRFNLAPGNPLSRGDSVMKSMYVKINRLITYNDDTDSSCENPIWLVWWMSAIEAGTLAPAVGGALNINFRTVVYFTDPS